MKPRRRFLTWLFISALYLITGDLHATPKREPDHHRGAWQGSRQVRYSTLGAGQYGPWTRPALLLIESADDWSDAMRTAGAMFPVAMPDIDWGHNVLVLLVLGEQPFAGFGIHVEEASRHAHDLLLRVHIELPDGTNPNQNFSTPYCLLVVERWRSMGVRVLYDAVVPELDRDILRPRREGGRGKGSSTSPDGGGPATTWSELKARMR
jgi:hypothetical protein